ncbi:MAG: hypothetical protein M1837_000370 [Sclerophora amabilis]|nr:MAG: hypothetical protein M1837_000370 [Sclerophora amabilis]
MTTEDGQAFIKSLAHFIRTHEKALANALQLRRQPPRHVPTPSASTGGGGRTTTSTISSPPSSPTSTTQTSSPPPSTSNTLAAALSLPSLSFVSQNVKPVKLSLTPHHLFYLLSQFEELSIPVGPMNVRLENLHADSSPANYVSFLSQPHRSKMRGTDRDSTHSVSSVRSVMSGMSSFWSSFGLGTSNSVAKAEKNKALIEADLKYLYSACTKIPCLRLAPDRKARLIKGYEEFPFDTAVPLVSFKNIGVLEISDIDIRQFFGWDRLAEQLRSLTVKRASVDDPTDLLVNIVLDDMDKRRRRSSKSQASPTLTWAVPNHPTQHAELARSNSAPGSPQSEEKLGHSASPQSSAMLRGTSEGSRLPPRPRPTSRSPTRPASSRLGSSHGHVRSGGQRSRRSGSSSSHSSSYSIPTQTGSSSNLLAMGQLPNTKWRFLKHLSLADNSLTSISAASLTPLANTLHSLDLASNLFAQIPDCLASLTALRSLNLSNCMIDSLHSLLRNPLPAITSLNLRANRLISIAGIERLFSLERLDIRENKLSDPTELARLTGVPEIREIWVATNPFTKTHSGHRVTIFNLFRNTPGYTEDILLDSSGPGYSERRQLIERVVEGPNVPVVKPTPTDDGGLPSATTNGAATTGQEELQSLGVLLKEGAPSRPRLKGEIPVGSHRRRRGGTKRRMVELSRAESPPTAEPSPASGPVEDRGVDSTAKVDQERTGSDPNAPSSLPSKLLSNQQTPELQPPPAPPRLDTTMAPPSIQAKLVTPTTKTPTKESQDWNISSEIYKKKIEALRNEVGNGWLSVLSEEGWDAQRPSQTTSPGGDFSPASTIRPSPTTPKASSQTVMSGGRSLG